MKFTKLSEYVHDLKFKLEDKGFLDKEIEMHLLLIKKEIDNIRDTEHKTKQRISELLYNL
ncbi:hypothetical protein [Anoxybacillus flavithermus]|uniref:Uncharacterized protein n=1 Tax=Anoxybacillus flavithermus TaxID=33934 RepID=A0A178TNT9_9BACL|nr:hypothetical protein [Anoxybacillus flavithermus]OAO82614.1 hypothetical protein TAF16_0234 [Anoxybacillus flavithermus]